MRIIILILIIAAIIAVFALPVRVRKKIERLIDNAISQSVFRQLLFLAVATGAAFCLLLLLIWINHGNLKLHLLDWIYTFINPGSFFTSEGKEPSDRGWAIVTGVVGMIFLSGMLISVISNIIERRVDRVKSGKAYYYFNNHIVIVGYNRMCIGLICQLAKDPRYGNPEIVLQTTREAQTVRHELFSGLESEIEKMVTIVSGNHASAEDLRRLYIDRCQEVFVLGEDGEYDHDSLHVECIRKIYHVLSERQVGRRIRCNVLFEVQSTFAVFQRQDMARLKDRIDFVPFNFYEMWAQKIFVEGKYESPDKSGPTGKFDYLPLDREGITPESDQKVQLVVVGMSRMGIALGVQAAYLCHFPNFVTKGIKTRITFIDENADVEMNYLRGRYRHLFHETEVYYREVNRSDMMSDRVLRHDADRIHARNAQECFTDIEFEFIRARVEYPAIQNYLSDLSDNRNIFLTVAICFSFPPKSLAAGLYLPDALYDHHVPILVQQKTPYCTLDLLTEDGKYKAVKPFGMLANCYDLDKADDRMPMMINYVYNNGIPEMFSEKEIVDMWHNLPTALKWSNRYNADFMKVRIRSLGNFDVNTPLTDEQIEWMARVEHHRWNVEKLLMGYRPTTPLEKEEIAKDPARKNKFKLERFAHDDIRAYDDLQVDANGTCAREYDRRISAALPFILKSL